MKINIQNLFSLLLIGGFILTTSCNYSDEDTTINYGIFASQDKNTATINGVIDSNTPEDWDDFIADFPDINRIIMGDCPGSDDDEANLQVAQKIRNQGIAIHLPATAEIASGAVDLFLAGTTRTRDAGSKIGVHAWSNGISEATDFPVGDEEHQIYIDYYLEMGYSQADAEAFYYFTINAAPAAEIHWMTDAEIEQYKLLIE